MNDIWAKIKASIQDAARKWWYRQTSTIDERVDGTLGKVGVDYETAEEKRLKQEEARARAEREAAANAAAVGERKEVFTWKVESENDGNAVVIFPSRFRKAGSPKIPGDETAEKQFISVRIEGSEHDESSPAGWSYANGNRWHARWRRPGSEYGKGFRIEMVMVGGEVEMWKINDGAKRIG
ncbi:MAG: hypothetical protein ABII82_04330 [Verrucomicrobiota bacterium]